MEEPLAIIKKSYLVLSEESGLLNMARVSGSPMLAVFGSTDLEWSAPQVKISLCHNTSDLECGNCLLGICKYCDIHCLTCCSPELVFDRSIGLLRRISEL